MKNVHKKVQVGKDQEKAQPEKDSNSKNRGGKITRLFHWYYVGGTIAKSRIDENIYNVMRQLVESNFFFFFFFF